MPLSKSLPRRPEGSLVHKTGVKSLIYLGHFDIWLLKLTTTKNFVKIEVCGKTEDSFGYIFHQN